MVTSVTASNSTSVGLPDDVNATTSAAVQTPAHPYKPTSVIRTLCEAVDKEVAAIHADARFYDSHRAEGTFDKISGAIAFAFGGLSGSVMSMASGLGHAALAFSDQPIETVKKVVTGLPAGIVQMGDGLKEGAGLADDGKFAEGAFVFFKSATDVVTLLTGAKAVLTGTTTLVRKSAQVAAREITAAAEAVNAGSGGAMATASGVYMSVDAAAAVKVAASPMPSSGLICGSLLMSVAPEGASSTIDTPPANGAQQLFTSDEMAQEIVNQLGGGNAATLKERLQAWTQGSGDARFSVVESSPTRVVIDTSTGQRITFESWELQMPVGAKGKARKLVDVADVRAIPAKTKTATPNNLGVHPRGRPARQVMSDATEPTTPATHPWPERETMSSRYEEPRTPHFKGKRSADAVYAKAGLSSKRFDHLRANPPVAHRTPRPRQEADIYGHVIKKPK